MGVAMSAEEHISRNKEAIEIKRGKTRWSLVPWKMFKVVGDVFTEGAEKYADDGWKYNSIEVYKDALGRHFMSYMSGETTDPDSGHSHLHHIIANSLILLWLIKEDDSEREKKS